MVCIGLWKWYFKLIGVVVCSSFGAINDLEIIVDLFIYHEMNKNSLQSKYYVWFSKEDTISCVFVEDGTFQDNVEGVAEEYRKQEKKYIVILDDTMKVVFDILLDVFRKEEKNLLEFEHESINWDPRPFNNLYNNTLMTLVQAIEDLLEKTQKVLFDSHSN